MGGDFFVFKKLIIKTISVNTNILQYKEKICLYKTTHVQTRVILLSGANKYKVRQSNISVLFGADILL